VAARSGSLAWVVLAGLISIGIASALWGLLDAAFVDELMATDSWNAAPGSVLETGRQYVITTWNWLLLVVVLRVGIEALVASRLTGATTQLPFSTVVLLFVHIGLVLWMLTIPEMAQPIYDMATGEHADALAALPGTQSAVEMGYQWGIGVLPAVLLVVADGWYLSAPIRNDLIGRGY
jgi:hypothetical protein